MSGAYTARVPLMLSQGYSPVTTVAGCPAMGVGDWASPPGWRPKWIWTGDIYQYAPTKGRKRASQEAPKLVLATTMAQEVALLSKPGHMRATEMPADVKDMLLDYYGHDLTAEQRHICADRIAARAAPPPDPVKAKAPAKKAAPKKGTKR